MTLFQTDPLHPLATFHWEECCEIPLKNASFLPRFQAAVLHEKLFVGVTWFNTKTCSRAELFASSTESDFTSWIGFAVPTTHFALTTYQSQLVLVGGKNKNNYSITDKLWVSDGGTEWKESLPPMPTKRYNMSAINIKYPECLVAVGGFSTGVYTRLSTVEILIERQWFTVKPLPISCIPVGLTVHNQNLYVFGPYHRKGPFLFGVYCSLSSLLEAGNKGPHPSDGSADFWRKLNTLTREKNGFISYSHYLLATSKTSTKDIDESNVRHSSKIYAYCPFNQLWLHIGYVPVKLSDVAPVIGPAGELIFVGVSYNRDKTQYIRVMKASLKVPPYDPGNQFDISALSRLEARGINVLTSLVKRCKERSYCVPFDVSTNKDGTLRQMNESDKSEIAMENAVGEWFFGPKSQHPSPTWSVLYDILGKLGLKELSQEIEEYLSSMMSLKELCISAITAALLQQRSLEPDQLCERLPDYVPTRYKHSIIHNFHIHKHHS